MTTDDLSSVKDLNDSVPFVCEVMIYEHIPEAQNTSKSPVETEPTLSDERMTRIPTPSITRRDIHLLYYILCFGRSDIIFCLYSQCKDSVPAVTAKSAGTSQAMRLPLGIRVLTFSFSLPIPSSLPPSPIPNKKNDNNNNQDLNYRNKR